MQAVEGHYEHVQAVGAQVLVALSQVGICFSPGQVD